MASFVANPIKIDADSWQLLSDMAASDARHDFDGVGETKEESKKAAAAKKPKKGAAVAEPEKKSGTYFSNIFFALKKKTAAYKEIGTGKTPQNAWHTWDTLEEVTRVDGTSGLIHDENFVEEVIPTDKDEESENVKRNRKLRLYQTTLELEINKKFGNKSYSVRSAYIGVKKMREKEGTYDGIDADTFLRMITENYENQPKNVYCQQDMSVISWDEFFRSKTANPEDTTDEADKQKLLFVNSREGQNDPAPGKMSLSTKDIELFKQRKVILNTVQEVAGASTILFPAFKQGAETSKSVFQNFNSIYNIQLSPIKTNGTVTQVSLTFLDSDLKEVCTLSEGKTENAINSLKKRLEKFFDFLEKKGSPNLSERNNYFTALQQKRGGDWLQVLCVFDRLRFGIDPEAPFLLITHDVICLSYALAMGIDAIFTRQVTQKGKGGVSSYEKYAIFFQNKERVSGIRKEYVLAQLNDLKTKIETYLDKTLETSLQKRREKYIASRTRIIDSKVAKIEAILGKFIPSYDLGNDISLVNEKVRNELREFFTMMFELSLANSIFPPVEFFEKEAIKDRIVEILTGNDVPKTELLDKIDATIVKVTQMPEGVISIDTIRSDLTLYKNIANILTKIYNNLSLYETPVSDVNILNMKTNSKHTDKINLFLKYIDPFPVQQSGGILKAAMNRFDSKDEKNKQDYSVLNYFIDNQLIIGPTNYQEKIKESLQAIRASIEAEETRLKGQGDAEGLLERSRQRAALKRVESAKTQFSTFLHDVVLYLTPAAVRKDDISLSNDLIGKILIEMNEITEKEISADVVMSGGAVFDDLIGEKILGYSDKKFPKSDSNPSKWKTKSKARWDSIAKDVQGVEKPVDHSFKIAYRSYYDVQLYKERDEIIFPIIYKMALGNPEEFKTKTDDKWKQVQTKYPHRFVNQEFKTKYIEFYKKKIVETLEDAIKKYPESDTINRWPVEKRDVFMKEYLYLVKDSKWEEKVKKFAALQKAKTEKERKALAAGDATINSLKQTQDAKNDTNLISQGLEKDQNAQQQKADAAEAAEANNPPKFAASTPQSLYLNTLLTKRNLEKTGGTPAGETSVGPQFFKDVRGIVSAGGGSASQSGGATERVELYSLPYDGFATLYLHQSYTQNQLTDIDSIQDGWDFPYLARKAQVLTVMQQIIEPTVKQILENETDKSVLNEKAVYYKVSKYCDALLTSLLPDLSSLGDEWNIVKVSLLSEIPEWLQISLRKTDTEIGILAGLEGVNSESKYLKQYVSNLGTILKAVEELPMEEESLLEAQRMLLRSMNALVKGANATEEETKVAIYKTILIDQVKDVEDVTRRQAMLDFIGGLTYSDFTDVGFMIDNNLIEGGGNVDGVTSILENFESARHHILTTRPDDLGLIYEPLPQERIVTVDPVLLEETDQIDARATWKKQKEEDEVKRVTQREENAVLKQNLAQLDLLEARLSELPMIPSMEIRKQIIDSYIKKYKEIYTDAALRESMLYDEFLQPAQQASRLRAPAEVEAVAVRRGGGGKRRRTRKSLRLKSRRRTHKKK